MSEKFHLGENGPRPCKADKKPCPLKSEDGSPVPHGTQSEMEKAYSEKMEASYGKIAPISKASRVTPGTIKKGTVIEPDADGLYDVEPGEYYYINSEDSLALWDDDEENESEYKFAALLNVDSPFTAMDIAGGKVYISSEGWSGIKNMLVSEKAMKELVKNGLEPDKEKVSIENSVRLSPTVLDPDKDDYLKSEVSGGKTIEELAWGKEIYERSLDSLKI